MAPPAIAGIGGTGGGGIGIGAGIDGAVVSIGIGAVVGIGIGAVVGIGIGAGIDGGIIGIGGAGATGKGIAPWAPPVPAMGSAGKRPAPAGGSGMKGIAIAGAGIGIPIDGCIIEPAAPGGGGSGRSSAGLSPEKASMGVRALRLRATRVDQNWGRGSCMWDEAVRRSQRPKRCRGGVL